MSWLVASPRGASPPRTPDAAFLMLLVNDTLVHVDSSDSTSVPEPGMSELVAVNVGVGRLRATTDFGVIADNDFAILALGTSWTT